ncbi:DUF2637 domain-containing protein [Janibacter sp. G1551]|uniref:DUF2637 domain-containing protein n=1 Tax=Janibacter sp. G1551 TaxID=3420440 RepID=UPI003CFCFE2A
MDTAPRGVRFAVVTAIAGTILIALGAFWLSFTALADLAQRSGISAGQAWAWPLIVDGIIVVATVAVVALAGQKAAWYPWVLLMGGAAVSVMANAIHAVLTADADVPSVLAAAVAAVPPVVLLAITHLTVVLTRNPSRAVLAEPEPGMPVELALPAPPISPPGLQPASPDPATHPDTAPAEASDRHDRASELRDAGWSNKKIARHLGVHPSTVGRWLPPREPREETDDPPGRVEEVITP